MTDDTQAQAAAEQQPQQGQLDPQFFAVVNEYLELTNRHSKDHGLKRISMASLYAASRFNAHVFLSSTGPKAAEERQPFLDYMTRLYRQMLNEHIDGLGQERGMHVGDSELKAELEYRRQQAEQASRAPEGAGDATADTAKKGKKEKSA